MAWAATPSGQAQVVLMSAEVTTSADPLYVAKSYKTGLFKLAPEATLSRFAHQEKRPGPLDPL